jgi:hypothetical protein
MIIRNDKLHSFNVLVTDRDAKIFNSFMKEELKFYNSIVQYYNDFFRSSPKDLADMKQSIITILYFLIKDGGTVKTLNDGSKEYLIANEKYVEEIKTKYIDLLNIVTTKAVIHNEVKANMFKDISNHYKGQASNVIVDSKNNIDYKFPVQLLQTQTIETKRHLQINRRLIKTTFDNDTKECRIKIPYSRGEIIVKGYDLRRLNWNIMILRQQKNKTVTSDLTWKAELLVDSSDYLITYVDNFKPFKKDLKASNPRDIAVTF